MERSREEKRTSGKQGVLSRPWFQGSSSSHERLGRSESGFIGPGVYLGPKALAERYAGPGGKVRKVEVAGSLTVDTVKSRYSEDLLHRMDEAGVEDAFDLLGVDAIHLVGRSGGEELVLADPSYGTILEEMTVEPER